MLVLREVKAQRDRPRNGRGKLTLGEAQSSRVAAQKAAANKLGTHDRSDLDASEQR